uniref:HU family DNA-binding protein n=1 Tax=Prevotella sp. TaxID=59823 RepID=UPI003FEFA0D6
MAKYKLQELNDMRDEGKRRVYPKMVTNRTLSRKEFVKMMQNYHRGISESITEAVLTDVVDMLADMLSMGYNVNLEGFGTFSLSLGFEDDKPTEMQTDDDMMKYRKVGVKNVNFNSSPEFVKAVKMETDCDLEREMSGVKVIRKQLYSKEERIARALDVIEKNGVLTLGDYASINNLSRTAASMELKELTCDKSSPIDSLGRGSHKVWVKRKE